MKLIYLGNNILNNKYKSLFKSLSIETIHYKNALKAIDNLTEIEPYIVLLNYNDYPRLWKIVLKGVRELYSENKTLFFIEGILDDEDIKAFSFLKGNLIVGNDSYNELKNYISERVISESSSRTYYPDENEIALGFVQPGDFSFVNGYITQIMEENFIFFPEIIDECEGIIPGTIVNNASISIEEKVIEVDFEVISNKETLLCRVINNTEQYKTLSNRLFI